MRAVVILTILCFVLVVVVCLLSMRLHVMSRDLYVSPSDTTVRLAASSALPLLGADGSIDGVVVREGDRVLVMGQRTLLENGVYIVSNDRWMPVPDPDRRSGAMIKVLEGQTYGGRVMTAFGDGAGGWHFVSLAEAVLGLPRTPDDILISAPDRPRGVRWASQNVLNPATLAHLCPPTSIPEKGVAIFDIPPAGIVELHVYQYMVRIGKLRLLSGRVVRRGGEMPKFELRDDAIIVRNTQSVAGMSAQLFSVEVPAG